MGIINKKSNELSITLGFTSGLYYHVPHRVINQLTCNELKMLCATARFTAFGREPYCFLKIFFLMQELKFGFLEILPVASALQDKYGLIKFVAYDNWIKTSFTPPAKGGDEDFILLPYPWISS